MFQHLEYGNHIVALALFGDFQLLDRTLFVGELGAQGRIPPRMGFRNGKNRWCGIDRSNAARGREAGGTLCEDAAAAANVEVGEALWSRFELGAEAGVDEVVTERVHEMEKARGTVGIPPLSGKSIEVGDFILIHRGELR